MTQPKFEAKDGQVDYTNVRYAPVVNIVVTDGSKILLVHRSRKLNLYPGYWNGVSGFIDDNRDIKQNVLEELNEELGIKKDQIKNLELGRPFLQEAPEYQKTWIVVPALAEVKTQKIVLDWEAEDAKWFTLDQIKKLRLLPGFKNVLKEFLPGFKIQ